MISADVSINHCVRSSISLPVYFLYVGIYLQLKVSVYKIISFSKKVNIARYSYSTWFVIQVIELLVQGKKYYDSLYGEAEIVATAYTNFGNRSDAIRESTYSICIDWTSALKFPYIRLFMPRMAFLHHVTPLSCEAYQSIKTKSLWRAPNPENLNFISTSYVHEQYLHCCGFIMIERFELICKGSWLFFNLTLLHIWTNLIFVRKIPLQA